jgi:hypothetical protein
MKSLAERVTMPSNVVALKFSRTARLPGERRFAGTQSLRAEAISRGQKSEAGGQKPDEFVFIRVIRGLLLKMDGEYQAARLVVDTRSARNGEAGKSRDRDCDDTCGEGSVSEAETPHLDPLPLEGRGVFFLPLFSGRARSPHRAVACRDSPPYPPGSSLYCWRKR